MNIVRADTQFHGQLRNVIADRIRTAILEGRFKPGEWMRQERLAREFGVSQMPVREALKELSTEGLIEHVPYRGARVISFSLDDIQDLYEHRAYLEGRAAFHAAKLISSDQITGIKNIQFEMENFSAPEHIARYRELNRLFHKSICLASKHDYLIRTLNQMWAIFPTMLIANFTITATHPIPDRDLIDIEEHRAIITALETRDATTSEKAVKEHILNTSFQLISFIRSQ